VTLLSHVARRPAINLRTRGGAALFNAGAMLTCLAAGVVVADPRFGKLLILAAGGVLVLVAFRYPLAVTTALLAVGAWIVPAGRFKSGFGPIDLRLEEVLLAVLLAVAVLRPRRSWWGGPAGGALAVFLLVVALSTLLALVTGRTDVSTAFQSARCWGMLTVFYVVVRLFGDRSRLTSLLLCACGLAAVGGLVALAVAVPGSALEQVLNPGESSLIRDEEGGGAINRVRLPAVVLAYVLFWYAVHRATVAAGTRRLAWGAVLAGMGVALALSFNRNMWAGILAGLGMVLVLGRAETRRAVAITLAVLVALAAGVALSGASIDSSSPLQPLVERGATFLSPGKTRQESSLNDRYLENRHAIATLREHPMLGVGPGVPFGAVAVYAAGDGLLQRYDQLFLHNQYLYVLLVGGPPALVALLVFAGLPMLEGFRGARRDGDLLALAVAIAMTLLSAGVMISFADPTSALVLGLVVGAVVVLGRGPAAVSPTAQDESRRHWA
jgi:O-antigen ligase